MLTENDVIAAVAGFLRTAGWTILQTRTTRQTGVDLVARHTERGVRLSVEAKGATSSKAGTARFGKPFNAAQVKDHVANVFYEAARVSEGKSAIAVPRDVEHERRMKPIRSRLATLNIAVFWVDADGVVDTWNWNPSVSSDPRGLDPRKLVIPSDVMVSEGTKG